MSSHKKWKKILVYVCIAFFLLTLVFVYLSFRGETQAGLIEVSCSASLFIILLHVIKKVIPQSMGTTVTVLSILIVVILIFANYSFQKNKNNEYTFREILIGDLFTKRIIGKPEEADKLLTKKTKEVIPGEFSRTTTEKHTIISSFEKPEKDLMGKPVTLQLDEPSTISISKEKVHSFYTPKETISYKLEYAKKEGLKPDWAKIATETIGDRFDELDEQTLKHRILAPMYLPLEPGVDRNRLFRAIHSKSEISADKSESEMQSALPEEHVDDEPIKQVEEKLQVP